MATIIPFEDVLRSRRRQQHQYELERCIEILSLNLRLVLDQLESADDDARPLHARRLRHLSELLEYAVDQQ